MLRYSIALLLAAVAYNAADRVWARTIYDGRWSLLIITDSGPCDRAYRYAVNIVNGRITYAGQDSFDIHGRVASNGTVRATVARGDQHATGTGRLSRDYGSGVWRGTSPTGTCIGRWTAERR